MRSEDAYDDEVRDGESVRVPVALMDGTQRALHDACGHRPGHAELTDEVRERRQATRDAYLEELTSAWKRSPAPRPVVDTTVDTAPDPRRRPQLDAASAQALRDATYRERDRALANAWRGRDAAPEPDDEPDADDRDAAYQSYKDRLQNAWRSNPSAAANAVESQRVRTVGR